MGIGRKSTVGARNEGRQAAPSSPSLPSNHGPSDSKVLGLPDCTYENASKPGPGYVGNLTEEQKNVMEGLRKRIMEGSMGAEEKALFSDDRFILRWCRARQFNLEKAYKMLNNYMTWRREKKPQNVTEEDVPNELLTGKLYIHRHNKEHRPCVVLSPRFHFPGHGTHEEKIDHVIFFMEEVSRRLDARHIEKCVVIYDGNKISMKNWDVKFSSQAVHIVQNYYPERLAQLYIIQAPLVVRTLFSIVKGWLDPETVNKIQFTKKELLNKWFDPADLPEVFGGTCPLSELPAYHPRDYHGKTAKEQAAARRHSRKSSVIERGSESNDSKRLSGSSNILEDTTPGDARARVPSALDNIDEQMQQFDKPSKGCGCFGF